MEQKYRDNPDFPDDINLKLELVKQLSEISFDFDKYIPILVQFKSSFKYSIDDKCGLTKYLYAAPIDSKVKEGDLVIIENGGDFNTARVSDSYNDAVDYSFIRSVKRVVKEINGTNSRIKGIKRIAFHLGDKDGDNLKPYFDNIERDKKRKKILKELEDQAAKAQKILMYQSLAKDNPEIERLLKELEEVETK